MDDMRDMMHEIRGDIKVLVSNSKKNEDIIKDHETRIRAGEKKMWVLTGLAAALGGFGEAILKAISKGIG